MRVLKHGAIWLERNVRFRHICVKCACEFEYSSESTKYDSDGETLVVMCPECKEKNLHALSTKVYPNITCDGD